MKRVQRPRLSRALIATNSPRAFPSIGWYLESTLLTPERVYFPPLLRVPPLPVPSSATTGSVASVLFT
jgi:hypothetical protein